MTRLPLKKKESSAHVVKRGDEEVFLSHRWYMVAVYHNFFWRGGLAILEKGTITAPFLPPFSSLKVLHDQTSPSLALTGPASALSTAVPAPSFGFLHTSALPSSLASFLSLSVRVCTWDVYRPSRWAFSAPSRQINRKE